MDQEAKWLLKEKYGGAESEAFRADLKRLAMGEPLGYVIGHVPFLGCQIYLDSKPLIPRLETEYWVEQAVTYVKSAATKSPRVLDLCAGSGCIGVAVAKLLPKAKVTFAEIDGAHLPTIEKNLIQNLSIDRKVLRERFKIVQSDLFDNVSGKFDFILSNPPYIDPTVDRTESSVKDHEPHLALYGGKDGLKISHTIINDSMTFLSPGGQLWLEHEPEQSEAVQRSAEAKGFRASTHKDQYGVERFSVLMP